MDLLQIFEFLARAGALGFLAYGLWLCLVVDPEVVAAVRKQTQSTRRPTRQPVKAVSQPG